ncbi:glycosyltransferase family 2 protein [Leisingera daeponensis]|uniref:Glycosyltransferase family 2 protein n=1 Tax=Leisingera daeponensis TaxID=405746 RepID=A0ABS7NDT1_9RHOB|nr:glycosyltransferase family 2 protein [Leisingera daeponensis]MBY6139352.1 glycosyltransferase family 2 protein [Leisingera daeponensis]
MSSPDAGNCGGKILEREFSALTLAGADLLDAVEMTGRTGRIARLFFRSGTARDIAAAISTQDESDLHNFGGAPVLDIPMGSSCGTASVSAGGALRQIQLQPEETSLFAGLNVLAAVRNGETAETAAQWLRFHVSQHRMQGAVILDRAQPKDSRRFVQDLQEIAGDIPGLERVVVVHSRLPLGKAGLPPEAHPFNVPGAPGKDRMEIPPADPWQAPLGEFLIYEILRARFLARARAVANIDLFDLIAPGGGPNVFDRAASASSGCLRLGGVQAYPWRVRKGDEPAFADHICTQFDATGLRPRWCLSPAKSGEDCIWRLIRVVGAEPDPVQDVRFYRCMALRHPADTVSKIVPKTSLVETPELLELATGYFGAKPVRIPEEQAVKRSGGKPRTAIVTTMKNEGPFILEWLAYHRAIGVDDFLVYTNDCTDGTDAMLQMLQEKGIVQHRENPFRGTDLKPQHAALQAAEDEPVIRNADWLICMDVDEFINIKCGEGRLADLFGAVDDANMISMTWRLFGNNDVRDFTGDLITREFTRCAHEVTRKPHQAWGFKTLFRNNGIFKKLGVHRPKGLKPQLWEDIRWVNGSGQDMPKEMFRNGWRSSMSTYGYDLVQLNHYAVRSAESFLVKRDRGRVNHVDRDQGLSYWFRMNNNAEEDRSIQRMIPALEAEMARLLADPDIAAAHEYSCRKHREKIEELKTRDDMIELFRELTGDKLCKLSRMHAHFGANVFLSGPGVIPDEIAEKEPGSDFWFTVERGETTH